MFIKPDYNLKNIYEKAEISESEREKVLAVLESGITKIDEATTEKALDEAYSDAVDALNAAITGKPSNRELEEARNNAIEELNDLISPTKLASNSPVSPISFVLTSSNMLSEKALILFWAFAPYWSTKFWSITSILVINSSTAFFSLSDNSFDFLDKYVSSSITIFKEATSFLLLKYVFTSSSYSAVLLFINCELF